MKKHSCLVLLLSIILALTGCATRLVAPTKLPAADTQAKARMGSIVFAIKWPKSSNFRTQLIPTDTVSVLVTITRNGTIMNETTLARSDGATQVSSETTLEAGEGYEVFAKGYDAQGKVRASGKTINPVTVVWGRRTPASVVMDPLDGPLIESVTPNHAAAGAFIELTGSNFGDALHPPTVIFPSNLEAIPTLDNGKIRVKVPGGAGTGNLVVKVAGIPSKSSAPFREIRSIRLAAITDAFDRNDNGAINTWLGDSFSLQATAVDSLGGTIANPSLTWSKAVNEFGTLNNGTYSAGNLGDDAITLSSGELSTTTALHVAPPAGTPVLPAGLATGMQDLSLCKVGERYLAAWYDPTAKKIYWQFFNEDGALGVAHSYTALGNYDERVVRVASNPNATVLAFRATANEKNAVLIMPIDPQTGEVLKKADGNDALFMVPFIEDASDTTFHLNDITTNGSTFALSYIRFTSSGPRHRTYFFSQTGNTHEGYRLSGSNNLIPPPTEDCFSVIASGSQYLVADHYKPDSDSTALQTKIYQSDGEPYYDSGKAIVLTYAKMMAAATNGDHYLVADLQVTPEQTTLYVNRLTPALTGMDPGRGNAICETNTAFVNSVYNTLSAVWNGHEYLIAFTRKVTVNNETVTQPMVVAVGSDGQKIGNAYPIAPSGTSPCLLPTDEGGLALWLSKDKGLICRRLKFR